MHNRKNKTEVSNNTFTYTLRSKSKKIENKDLYEYNIVEEYSLYCKEKIINFNFTKIKLYLEPLIDSKEKFMFSALYTLLIPENYANKFYDYFREKAL